MLLIHLAIITTLNILQSLSLPDLSQSCVTNESIPFTGYKVEYQLNLKDFNGDYHLLYCHDNKLIYDLNLNETIPWTEPLNFSKTEKANPMILSRRKTFALRTLPIYLPNTLVGSLYYSNGLGLFDSKNANQTSLESTPLLAANIMRNWVEVTYKMEMIYHVPILTTPGIDSKRYRQGFFESHDENNWDKYISMSEDYNFNYDSRIAVRQIADTVFAQINRIMDSTRIVTNRFKSKAATSNGTGKLFWKLIMLSKLIRELSFNLLLQKIDQSLTSLEKAVVAT